MNLFEYKTQTTKNKVQELPAQGSKVVDILDPESNKFSFDKLQGLEKQPTPRRP
jgi:hypothetical protein